MKGMGAARVKEREEVVNKFPYQYRLSRSAPLSILFANLLRWSKNSSCFLEDQGKHRVSKWE
jgi:hypothetical protein